MIFQRLLNKIRLFAWIFHARCAIIFTDVDKYSSVRIAAIFADKKKVFDKRREGGVLSKTYYHYSRVPFGYYKLIIYDAAQRLMKYSRYQRMSDIAV